MPAGNSLLFFSVFHQEFPDNMCLVGIGCTVYGACTGSVGVFTGTQCDDNPISVRNELFYKWVALFAFDLNI